MEIGSYCLSSSSHFFSIYTEKKKLIMPIIIAKPNPKYSFTSFTPWRIIIIVNITVNIIKIGIVNNEILCAPLYC